MKTIFDKPTREALVARINLLNEKSAAQWGTMNVYQVIKHCTLWDEMMLGDTKQKQAFIGKIFGKMALRSVLKDEAPLKRSTPTSPQLRVKENGDVAAEKAKWISSLDRYADFSKPEIMHVFFGKMTKEQLGYMAYKHIDHHLRQFNG
ncbi:hypothetical protein BH11BAC7_BH11BAC7_12690 [soil metagenome]